MINPNDNNVFLLGNREIVVNAKVTNTTMQDVKTLTLLFITLKLCGVIEWSWAWVLSPLLITFGCAFLSGVIDATVKQLKERLNNGCTGGSSGD